MKIPPSSVQPQPSRPYIPAIAVGPRPLKERCLSKFKKMWQENTSLYHSRPLEMAFLGATFIALTGVGAFLGGILVNKTELPEKPGIVQIQDHHFVPAYDEYSGRILIHHDDAWYVSGKVIGQDPSQKVDVEVSKQEFQTDKMGQTIPVVFSETRLTHSLEARRVHASQNHASQNNTSQNHIQTTPKKNGADPS